MGAYRNGVTTDVDPRTPALRAADDADGLYGPHSEAWSLNREATLLLAAGPRALLLQIAHPLVAEGVDQHSAFRSDPWGRLAATLRSYLTIVYGDGATARAEIGRLGRLHRTVVGPVRDPLAVASTAAERYAARDPALALWVHATLVDSTIVAYDAWIEPLSAARRERFYAETRPIGRAFGIPDELLPVGYDAFADYVAAMLGAQGPVHPTPTARALALAILHPPLSPLLPGALGQAAGRLPRSAVTWTMWPSVALLPSGVRDEFGLVWDRPRRLVAGWLTAGIRAWRPLFPTSWREMPQARRADRRVTGADRRILSG